MTPFMGESGVKLFYSLRIAGMNHDAIVKAEIAACRDRDAAVQRFIVTKIVLAERIGGIQPIAARVPISRMLRILRVVEDGDPEFLPLDARRIVHPTRTLAPDLL